MAANPGDRTPLPPLKGTPLALLTVAIAFATFMEVLDITIVNVSVPHIAGSLGVSPQEGTWAISSYSLASAIMQPLSGWIARQFGEVRSFCVSALLFVIMSVLCGFATSMPMLVIGRLLQGAGSGPMVALSLSLLLNNYPIEKKGLALALWAMTVVVAPIFGPILGGFLTDNYSWPWIFYINVPVGLLAVAITWTLLRNRESKIVKTRIDTVGLVLLVLGVGALLTGLYLSLVRTSSGFQGGSVLTSPSALLEDAKGAVEQMNLRQKQQEEELRKIQSEH
jgi:DHA2 family multidrug resistance protein